jgi:phosphopantetheinyl transferase (holo-ACP synthase)
VLTEPSAIFTTPQERAFGTVRVLYGQAETGAQAVTRCKQWLARHHGFSDSGMQIVRHSHLQADAALKISISHTRTLGVLATTDDPAIGAIGCDVEFADRPMRAGSGAYFLNEQDDAALAGELLRAWALKEAAFKALDPVRELWTDEAVFLRKLWVSGGDFGLVGANLAIGQVGIEPFFSQGQTVLCALARIANTPALSRYTASMSCADHQ